MSQPVEGFALPDPDLLRESAPSASGGSNVGQVLERQHDALMGLPGVVMIGEGQDEVGRPAIVVGVKEAHHLKSLPHTMGSVRVVGMVIGEVDALAGPVKPPR